MQGQIELEGHLMWTRGHTSCPNHSFFVTSIIVALSMLTVYITDIRWISKYSISNYPPIFWDGIWQMIFTHAWPLSSHLACLFTNCIIWFVHMTSALWLIQTVHHTKNVRQWLCTSVRTWLCILHCWWLSCMYISNKYGWYITTVCTDTMIISCAMIFFLCNELLSSVLFNYILNISKGRLSMHPPTFSLYLTMFNRVS